ncbi:hypothetical protein ACL02T_32990 [Pseudonocardia sp. RS010]|uniref:hypothetical protein n=1 Tax=Pseudonocardia sp. RS010 TaxID=3385979 RepID=UPI0039A3DD0A
MYDDPRWPLLRDQVLSEEPACAWDGCGEASSVADHIKPHRGDEQLAFERSNLQGLCSHHHGVKTASETFGRRRVYGA